MRKGAFIMNRFVIAAWLCLTIGVFPARAADRLYTYETDVPYSKLDNGKELMMDIATPTGKGPFPAVVCVHGGAWRFGNRKDMEGWAKFLAIDGYVAATITYRLLPDAKFPEPIIDCKTAVRFLRANAAKFHIDRDRIGAMGYSAGGHLVSLLGTTDSSAGFDGKEYPKESSQVQAVVDYFGPCDLRFYGKDDSAQSTCFTPLLGKSFKDDPSVYLAASPIKYVNKDSAPFLIMHGTRDWLVSVDQSREMNAKLKEAGVPVWYLELEGANHGFTGKDSSKSTSMVAKFLAGYLKK